MRLLDDGFTFIPSLLRRVVETTKPWQDFDVLVAVVDRIPQTRSTTPYGSRGSHVVDAELSHRTWLEDGLEGISVATLDSEVAAPDLWSPRNKSNERETMTIQQRCTLSFSLPPSPGVRTQLSDSSVSQPLVKRVVQLPVANTLFQNGRTSTLFAQRWSLSFSKEPTSEFVCSKKAWLPQQVIEMGAVFADEGLRFQLDHRVHSRLVAITPARTITDAVGNIVRRVSGSVGSAEAAPASEELERAISTAIKQGQMPAQQAGVWALVRPQKYAALDRVAQLQGTVPDLIQYAILSGARLHKVLSGGGGWGEKHGLLALDPDSDYSHHHRAFETSFGDEQDVEADKREALGEVAKPGDTITFYVYTSPPDADPVNLHKTVFWKNSQATAATLTFGSLPSAMDTIPEVDTTETEAYAQSELAVEGNHFGMLSEQGMSLESSFINTNINANRMQYLRTELYREAYEVRRRNTVITKLDAPYTLLSIRGQASKVPVNNEIKGEELRAPNAHLEKLMPQEPLTATRTTKFASALVQRTFKVNDQKQEAQPLIEQGHMQDEQASAKTHRGRTEEQRSKLTRKELRTNQLEASKAQSEKAQERNKRVAEEAKVLTGQHPEISDKTARKIARKATRKAANEEEQENYKLQALVDTEIEEAESGNSLETKAFVIHQKNRDRGKTDDGSGFAVRFTFPEHEPVRKANLWPEAQDAPPSTIKRHFSASLGNYHQKRGSNRESKPGLEAEPISGRKPFPEDVKYGLKPLREAGEGKSRSAYKSKEGKVFMLTKHFTMNTYERLQAIRQVGEITGRDHAMGLHSQYHLPLFQNQPEEVQKS